MKTNKKKYNLKVHQIYKVGFFLMQNAHNFFSLSISLTPNKPYNQPAEMLFCFFVYFSPVRFEVADIYKLTTIKENKSKTNEQNCTSSKKFDNL